MKKSKGNIFLNLVIALSFVLCNTLTVFAQPNTTTTKINEYDLIAKQSNLSTNQLKDLGYSAREAVQVKNYKSLFNEKVKEMQTLPDNELKRLGYKSDEIQVIRNFNGSEEQLRAIAAEVSISLTCKKCKYSSSSDETNSRLYITWEWDGTPVFKTNDMIGIQYNDWQIDEYSSEVNYTHINGSESDFIRSATKVVPNNYKSQGVGFKIKMTQQDNYFWANSGEITLDLVNYDGKQSMSAYTEYGHTTVQISPSFGWSGSVSMGFDFGWGCGMVANDWADRKCS